MEGGKVMIVDESRFVSIAAKLLSKIAEAVDDAGLDAELNGNVLVIELEDERQFIVNSNAPLRQIWLASPVSGASHYESKDDGNSWVSTRSGDGLLETLAADIKKATGSTVAF